MEHDPELKRYMKLIAVSNRWDQVIFRGCLIGVFTAVGTTIGFALLLLVAGQFVSTFKQVPLLDTILEQTKLDLLIENQLNRLNETPSEGSSGNETPEPATPLIYNNKDLNFSFSYPAYLSSSSENVDDEGNKYVQFTGEGDGIQALDLYTNLDVTVKGLSTQRFANIPDLGRVVVYIYEQGGSVNNEEYNAPIYFAQVNKNGTKVVFVAYGEKDLPKLGREIFTDILETLKFD
ncbi:MAG: hypothetical protein JNK26_02580 [Candidatus Doudnabacteria bacterium]|nr:hypothetical protein [Candidatus Doudnabacteria bacterium]